MNLPIIGIARDRSADKGDKAKGALRDPRSVLNVFITSPHSLAFANLLSRLVSKKYAELYDSPRRSVQYAELPQHDVTLAMGPEPAAFVASPAVAEVRLPRPISTVLRARGKEPRRSHAHHTETFVISICPAHG